MNDLSKHISGQGARRWMDSTPPSERAKRGDSLSDLARAGLRPDIQPRGAISPRMLRRTYAWLALIAHRQTQPRAGISNAGRRHGPRQPGHYADLPG